MTSKQERKRLEALDARSREELARRDLKAKEKLTKTKTKDAAEVKPPER